MPSLDGRMRFLYVCNIAVTAALALVHLFAPRHASINIWGASPASFALTTPYSMLGAWWGAVAVMSFLGLSSPLKWSPVMMAQALYKIFFLVTTVAPLIFQGKWSSLPALSTAVYSAYLPLVLACAPWGYMLGNTGPDVDAGREKVE